jgi:hypothetical protein
MTVLQKVFLGHLAPHGVSVAGGYRFEALTEDAEVPEAGSVLTRTAAG